MTAYRDGLRVVLATGDERIASTVFDAGAINCPWCGGGWPADSETCPNPACLASLYADADSVRAALAEQVAADARQAQATSLADSLAQMAADRQAAERAAWSEVAAAAEGRGACLICLRASRWRLGSPRYVRHRRADFHT